MRYVLFIFILVIVSLVAFDFFLKDPAIWPDEAIWADIANNILNEGRLGTDLLSGTFPGIEKCACWYPSLFFYTIAGWFKLFGLSIVSLRLLSVFFSILFLIVFYLFSRLFTKSKWVPLLVISLLIIDLTFIRTARLGRPEIFVMFWGMLSLYFFKKAEDSSLIKNSNIFFTLSGISAGFAFLNHFFGIFYLFGLIVYLLIKNRLKIFLSPKIYILGLSFLLPIIIWLILIYPYWDILREQLTLVMSRKNSSEIWMITVFRDRVWSLKLAYFGYLLTTLIFLIYGSLKINHRYLFYTVILVVTWIFFIDGKELWYTIYILPLTYFAAVLLLEQTLHTKSIYKFGRYFLITIIILFLLLPNLSLHYNAITSMAGDNFSYSKFTEGVLKIIPDQKTVFLSSIPDPYFGFKQYHRQNILYEFPLLPTKTFKQDYLQVLEKCDFIVYNGSYEGLYMPDFLPQYIEKNSLKTYKIGETGQYQVIIAELKPKTQRVAP